jgi:hypothetical protein
MSYIKENYRELLFMYGLGMMTVLILYKIGVIK